MRAMKSNYLSLKEAYDRALEADAKLSPDDFLGKLRGCLELGQLRAWGALNGSATLSEIPPITWSECAPSIEADEYERGAFAAQMLLERTGRSDLLRKDWRPTNSWSRLQFERAAIEAIWPCGTGGRKLAARPERYKTEKRDGAREIIKILFPDEVPHAVSNAEIVRIVESSCEYKALNAKPHSDTILRAAGRKS
jgi:hypothetical protein